MIGLDFVVDKIMKSDSLFLFLPLDASTGRARVFAVTFPWPKERLDQLIRPRRSELMAKPHPMKKCALQRSPRMTDQLSSKNQRTS